MMSLRTAIILLPLGLGLAACATKTPPPAPVASVTPPTPAPMPQPPAGAAANLTIPAKLADGSFATPNRALSGAGTLWHLRAALNVAALQCGDVAAPAAYNQLLKVQKSALAMAHKDLAAEYRTVHGAKGEAEFDGAMTRLYNYFALPPARAAFCAAATPVLQQAMVLPAGGLPAFAPTALAQLEAPFVDFYRSYDAYRVALAEWRATGGASTLSAVPRLAYHAAVFGPRDTVTGGR